jgi:hypothetical protein
MTCGKQNGGINIDEKSDRYMSTSKTIEIYTCEKIDYK